MSFTIVSGFFSSLIPKSNGLKNDSYQVVGMSKGNSLSKNLGRNPGGVLPITGYTGMLPQIGYTCIKG